MKQFSDDPNDLPSRSRILIVTGMSGAGKTSTLKLLEDIGFEAVDNVPISLMKDLVATRRPDSPSLAIGADIRTRDFAASAVLSEMDKLIVKSDLNVDLIFLDCDNEVLGRRFSETRRRHPLAQDRPAMDGIILERQLVFELQEMADLAIDTSCLLIRDLKNILQGHFGSDGDPRLTVSISSFSYKKGLPREADLVFDVRFLRNPYYDPLLSGGTGLDKSVGEFITLDDGFHCFFENLKNFLKPQLPRFLGEGRSYLTIAIGCTGGRHRSVFVAQKLGEWLEARGENVIISHREVNADR